MGIEEEKLVERSAGYLLELGRNPNLRAFEGDLQAGRFDSVEPDTWVVYQEGQLMGMGTNRDELLEPLGEQGTTRPFCTQVNKTPRPIIRIRSPRLVRPFHTRPK